MQYYFFDSILAPLSADHPAEMRWSEFIDLASVNLTQADWRQLCRLRTWYDLLNLRNLWLGIPLSHYGNMNMEALEAALATGSDLPDMVWEFLERYKDPEARVDHLSELLSEYLREQQESRNDFLAWFVDQERQYRLVFACARALEDGLDLHEVLRFESPEEPFVAYLLAHRGGQQLQAPFGFEAALEAWRRLRSQPFALAQQLLKLRLDAFDEAWRMQRFHINHILCYAARLVMVEQLYQIDVDEANFTVREWLRRVPEQVSDLL